MSAITTHVLDAVLGKPASGIVIRLEKQIGKDWTAVGESITDSDGRCRDLCQNASCGICRMTFAVGPYFDQRGRASIYPEIVVAFRVDGEHHYHIPLLLSDNSYTSYRGS